MNKANLIWNLKDAVFKKDKGSVFSCFSCGGGSTMGYKLAGFDVIGCCEIDKNMIEIYKKNHSPVFSFNESIVDFKKRENLPGELYNLDILDGSPPCSSFSRAGSGKKSWGKLKKFREGQEKQVLDTLFFDFIDLAKKLKPKVVVAENVPDIFFERSKHYALKIYKEFDEAGYILQHFFLDASKMGVPQSRKRVFFIALRKDLCERFMKKIDLFDEKPEIRMDFDYPEIEVRNFVEFEQKKATINYCEKRFGDIILKMNKPAPTITSGIRFWKDENLILKENCYRTLSSFPQDFDFFGKEVYVTGMSVPPLVMKEISSVIYETWLKYI